MADESYRAFTDLVRLPMSGGAELVYAPLSRTAHALTSDAVRLLFGCRGIATIEDHATRLAGPGRPVSDVRRDLATLARQGLLVSRDELLRRLGDGDHSAPPRVTAIGMPTVGHVASLTAAIESYIENGVRFGRSLEYVVVDDSEEIEAQDRTRAAIAATRARHAVPIAYAGRREKEQYAKALAEHGAAPREVIEFALLNPEGISMRTGANRNALLLHTAGELVIQVDDDTRCLLARAADPLPGAALTSLDDPTELWFDDSPVRQSEDRDFCSVHEELLGKRPGDAAAASDLEMSRASGMFFRRLAPSGGRVLTTQLGGSGDSGTGSMAHYLTLVGGSRARLHASEATYQRAFTSRHVVRAARRPTIVDGGFCMSMNLGLDNRAPLPPFFPVQRNSDGIFGAALRVCFHSGYQGFLPWTVMHTPASPRVSSFESLWASIARPASGDVLAQLVLSSRVEADKLDPTVSLRALGTTLERWGSLPLDDFEEIARIHLLRAKSVELALFDDVLRAFKRSPAYWASDVDRAASIARAAALEPSLAYPSDLIAMRGEGEGRALFARLVKKYGELLRYWPDLVRAALDLRAKGIRLAQPA